MKIKVKAKSFDEAFEKCPWATTVSKTKGNFYICTDEE